MNNRTYDILKWIARYLLPALGTLYFALSGIWGFAYGEEVVGTIAALTAFLGVILGLSTKQYNKTNKTDGVLEIDEHNWDKDIYRLNLSTGLSDLKHKKEITLKVDPNSNISQEEQGL